MLKQRGFSIIELAVTMAIVAVLVMLGMPSLTEYIGNARLGSTAQSFYAGLTRARSEAIRLNQHVEFAMTNSPIVPGIENTLVADTGGQNWVVRGLDPTSGLYVAVDSHAAKEGGGLTPGVTINAANAIVSFDGLGAANGTKGLIQIENPPAGLCVPAGPVRCWNIVVGSAGQVRLCDPAAAQGDTRACSP